MPTQYEPVESTFRNQLYGQQSNPARLEYVRDDNPMNPAPPQQHADVFPFVFTTSRLTEHHTAGGMCRSHEHPAELQPEHFVEVSPVLADPTSAVWGRSVSGRVEFGDRRSL